MLVVLGSLACSCSFCAKFEPAEGCYSEEGDAAVVKVVESQMELYELEHDKEATVETCRQLATSLKTSKTVCYGEK